MIALDDTEMIRATYESDSSPQSTTFLCVVYSIFLLKYLFNTNTVNTYTTMKLIASGSPESKDTYGKLVKIRRDGYVARIREINNLFPCFSEKKNRTPMIININNISNEMNPMFIICDNYIRDYFKKGRGIYSMYIKRK